MMSIIWIVSFVPVDDNENALWNVQIHDQTLYVRYVYIVISNIRNISIIIIIINIIHFSSSKW